MFAVGCAPEPPPAPRRPAHRPHQSMQCGWGRHAGHGQAARHARTVCHSGHGWRRGPCGSRRPGPGRRPPGYSATHRMTGPGHPSRRRRPPPSGRPPSSSQPCGRRTRHSPCSSSSISRGTRSGAFTAARSKLSSATNSTVVTPALKLIPSPATISRSEPAQPPASALSPPRSPQPSRDPRRRRHATPLSGRPATPQ